MTDESGLPWPDDVGVYRREVPDAISLRDFAREAGSRNASSSHPGHGLRGADCLVFGEESSTVWAMAARSSRLNATHARSAEELWAHTKSRRDTLARRAIYWTAREYAGFTLLDCSTSINLISGCPTSGAMTERLTMARALPTLNIPE